MMSNFKLLIAFIGKYVIVMQSSVSVKYDPYVFNYKLELNLKANFGFLNEHILIDFSSIKILPFR
jgi:hypothetical protein